MINGITETTAQNMQLNAGVLLSAFTPGQAIQKTNVISATSGGASFSAVPTIRQSSVDGIPTNTIGFDRIDEWVVTLTATVVEFTENVITRMLGCCNVETVATTGKKITSTNNIKTTDYKDVWWVGEKSDGSMIAIKIKNALNKTGLSATFNDKGDGTMSMNMTGHYVISDLETGTAPYELYLLAKQG